MGLAKRYNNTCLESCSELFSSASLINLKQALTIFRTGSAPMVSERKVIDNVDDNIRVTMINL